MVEARASQAGLYGLLGNIPETRVAQAGIYALIATGVPARVSQLGLYGLVAVTPEVRVSQTGVYILASGSECVTSWAQIWTIIRTDGVTFRFTSLDRDLVWQGQTYKSCNSLVPSASEAVSEVDAAGNMDLSGSIGPEGITEHDLYSGLFDYAAAEAWLVPWEGIGLPRLLMKGTWGPISQTKSGFKAEMLGDGAKLMQTPLVSLLAPGCRWEFGDPVTCQKALGPLTVAGTVDSATGQRSFVDAARGEAAGYFRRGKVTFTSGDNAGVSAEIKEHASGGSFELWPRLPYPISVGDGYSMTPGCTLLMESAGGTNGCEAWGQELRYKGYLKVPGKDKRSAGANVRTS